MPTAKTINQFLDVKAVLDAALAALPAEYELPDRGKATHWRQRAYTFIRLYRDQEIARNVTPGLVPSTPYDILQLAIDKKRPTVVTIRRTEPRGVLRSSDGRTISPAVAVPLTPVADASDLDLAARALIERHAGD